MSWDGRIRADARHIPLADSCVQCVVTSPPYWGLRDYGNVGQLGLERTPEEYVASMVAVFREVWRVLKADGVLWLNLGDSYAGAGRGSGGAVIHSTRQTTNRGAYFDSHSLDLRTERTDGLAAKNLVGIPWRVAFALQADGWYLRSDVIWSKPNPMPESVTDRPTKAHEYIFLLTKSERYFYDADAIEEPAVSGADLGLLRGRSFADDANVSAHAPSIQKRQADGIDSRTAGDGFRNKRTVWNVATQAYPEAHYATFPEEIPEICIKAGSRPGDMILDPFFGSGTVGRVAERLNRRWVGLDLGYQDLQSRRLNNIQKEISFA